MKDDLYTIEIIPYGVIYKSTNKLNGKIYIGKTVNYIRRMNEYKTRKVLGNKKYNYNIMREINLVGFNNFTSEVIDYAFSKEQLEYLEKFYIITYDAINPNIGYNSRTGDLNEPLNNKTRELMSKSHLGLTETSITKRKKSKKVIAFKDNIWYIADSGKLFADYIDSSKDMVSHAINKCMKIQGYYVFRYDTTKDLLDKYNKLKDKNYAKLYMEIKEGLETIEKSLNVVYIQYDD